MEWTQLAWTFLNFHENQSEVIKGDRLKDTKPVLHYKPPPLTK